MYKYGVIVIGYKNVESIQRLLEQLNRAEYGDDNVLMIISIDYSGENAVRNCAEEYVWEHGKKIIIEYHKRQGLRQHVLKCGDYLDVYELDAAAVFEDDIFPSVDYYNYMKAATNMYYNDRNIEGISLYAHSKNLHANESFTPIQTNWDAYFLQYAQSWGQVWFRNRWKEFREWYSKNSFDVEPAPVIPQNVSAWNENSWLKFHIKYCIENNKYFVYPYIALSTCFSEKGEHTLVSSNRLQISLLTERNKQYKFPEFSDEALRYDAFFENMSLDSYCGVERDDLEIDLYGMRISTSKRFLLSKKRMEYPIIKSWGDCLTPHEMNVIYNIPGEGIFLYDLSNESEVYMPKKERPREKFECYFDLLDKWLMLYEKQEYFIPEYFKKHGINTVAIYGYGKLGKHFIQLLEKMNIHVAYVIDRNVRQDDDELKVFRMEEELPNVDCIVVTPVMEFKEIKDGLSGKYAGKIISLEELF